MSIYLGKISVENIIHRFMLKVLKLLVILNKRRFGKKTKQEFLQLRVTFPS